MMYTQYDLFTIYSVCPTHVGMYRQGSSVKSINLCLSHACGNVSVYSPILDAPVEFIPRMWECIVDEYIKGCEEQVYPTHVGMSQKRRGCTSNCMRLSHVCGNVSEKKMTHNELYAFIPRMWECI